MTRAPPDRIVNTCAVTGNLTMPAQTPHLPVTPEGIADGCLGAGEAGAAVAHAHVREPGTGKPSMELGPYQEAVERVRRRNTDLILNGTTGLGSRCVPSDNDPAVAGPGTTLVHPEKRVAHIAALRPDICTLDLNTMNWGGQVVINTPGDVRRMARVIREAGVKPEIELFDWGDIALMHDPVADGSIGPSPLCSFAMTAQSFLAGGHVRAGLEASVYLEKGVLAPSNAAMVAKVRGIVEALGGQVASPAEARALLGLPARGEVRAA